MNIISERNDFILDQCALQDLSICPSVEFAVTGPIPLTGSGINQLRRQQAETDMGFQFEPAKVMKGARNAAKTTRVMADLIDTRGTDFLSLLGDYTSQGNGLHDCTVEKYISFFCVRLRDVIFKPL